MIIEKVSMAREVEISIAEKAFLIIKNNGMFSEKVRIIANYHCHIEIGRDFLCGACSIIRAGDGHSLFDVLTGNKRNFTENLEREMTEISDHVWIGYGVNIISPVFIGSGCNIGAKSVVKGKYPNNCAIAGIPAKVIHENSAWHGSPLVKEISAIISPFAVPTLRKSNLQKEMRTLSEETELCAYMNRLSCINQKIIILAVKDTPGYKFDEMHQKAFKECGLNENLINKHWSAYIGVLENERVLCEKLSETDGGLEEALEIEDIKISIVSQSLHAGNKAIILVNSFDFSTNHRGINIVVIDKKAREVADSVCFDTHVVGCPCIRQFRTC